MLNDQKLGNNLEVSNRTNQFQIQVARERRDPISRMTWLVHKMKEKRPVFRRWMLTLFTETLFLRKERGDPFLKRVQSKHVHLKKVRITTLKWHMKERGDSLLKQTQKMCQMIVKHVLVNKVKHSTWSGDVWSIWNPSRQIGATWCDGAINRAQCDQNRSLEQKLTVMGKAIWENLIEMRLGKDFQLVMLVRTPSKRVILICVCG